MKVVCLFALFFCAVAFSDAQSVFYGHAEIFGASDAGVIGYVTFSPNAQNSSLIDMAVNVSGITMNKGALHGVHIHQYGDISNSSGLAAGGHWNPTNAPHGCPGNVSRHYGDCGNWNVDANGNIVQTKTLDLLAITGQYSIIGLAVIIHNATDDCATVPSSGTRLAQGVIGIANPTYVNAAVNNATSFNFANLTSAICVLKSTGFNGTSVTGWVEFITNGMNTTVLASIQGLDGNVHGFHVHQFGDLRDQTGALSTGAHFNPLNNLHAIPPFNPRHVGDMGNLYFYNTGVAYYTYNHDLISLNGANSVIGHAVIVHNQPDNCGQPTGNAGTRLASCVI